MADPKEDREVPLAVGENEEQSAHLAEKRI